MLTKDKQLCVLEEKKLLLEQEEKEKDRQFQREMRELEEEGNKKQKKRDLILECVKQGKSMEEIEQLMHMFQ